MAGRALSPEIRSHYTQLASVWEQLANERLAFFIPRKDLPAD